MSAAAAGLGCGGYQHHCWRFGASLHEPRGERTISPPDINIIVEQNILGGIAGLPA